MKIISGWIDPLDWGIRFTVSKDFVYKGIDIDIQILCFIVWIRFVGKKKPHYVVIKI